MTIDILCKVVDNYGDIGVVYRLTRAIKEIKSDVKIRLITDNYNSFSCIHPSIDTSKILLETEFCFVFPWNLPNSGSEKEQILQQYSSEPPSIILECFACGRPDWLEHIIFSNDNRNSVIINLEYLTAESYAEEFHKIKGLTRSSYVRKYMFLPGFTPNTGGLILNKSFMTKKNFYCSPKTVPDKANILASRVSFLKRNIFDNSELDVKTISDAFWITIFSYKKNYTNIIKDIAEFSKSRPVVIFAAQGVSQENVYNAWNELSKENSYGSASLVTLPFLPQEEWDELLLASDFNIVRGEDSLSRAVLSGKPFIWQAYPQEENYHIVKVNALWSRLTSMISDPSMMSDFTALYNIVTEINAEELDSVSRGSMLNALQKNEKMLPFFIKLSFELESNGNLALNLMTFIDEIC